MTLFLILHILILQIMDSPYQLSERTRPDCILSFFKAPYCWHYNDRNTRRHPAQIPNTCWAFESRAAGQIGRNRQ
jgi:hypothetical protein